MLANANLFEYYRFVLFNPPFTTAVSMGARVKVCMGQLCVEV